MEFLFVIIIPIIYLVYTFFKAVREDVEMIESLNEEIESLEKKNELLTSALEPQLRKEVEDKLNRYNRDRKWVENINFKK